MRDLINYVDDRSMTTVTFIGAGSVVFTRQLVADLLPKCVLEAAR